MMRIILGLLLSMLASAVVAGPRDEVFANIDGGTLTLNDWPGQPVLVVNTASQCGFTYQYEGLQALYDAYKDRGLVVLAVPSDDFDQELGSAEEVKEFCEVAFGLDLPMADITSVRGAEAHPFYAAVKQQTGFEPRWNFNKVLIGAGGKVLGTFGSNVRPQSRRILQAIEPLLSGS
ncbi:MAG: glutathione peroxidase [Pseudomonadota bacterium]